MGEIVLFSLKTLIFFVGETKNRSMHLFDLPNYIFYV